MELKSNKSGHSPNHPLSMMSSNQSAMDRPSTRFGEFEKQDSAVKQNEIKQAMTERLSMHKRFMTFPSAILCIHVKQCSQVRLDYDNLFAKNEDVNVYIRFIVGMEKVCTSPEKVHVRDLSATLVFDNVRHLILQDISNTKDHPSNNIRMELVGFSRSTVHMHTVVGKKEIHLYEIIKKMQAAEPYELRNDNNFVVGRLEVEFVFAYGKFGYGYSSQLDDYRENPSTRIQHSLFLRVDPPENRRATNKTDIMNCVPVPHPTFINFTTHAEIGMGKEFALDEQVFQMVPHRKEPICLISRMRRRMYQLQKEFSELETRQGRLLYLRRLLTGREPMQLSMSSQTMVAPQTMDNTPRLSITSRTQDDIEEEQLAKEAAAIAALYRKDVNAEEETLEVTEEHEVKTPTPKSSVFARLKIWWRKKFLTTPSFRMPDVFIEPATPPSSSSGDSDNEEVATEDDLD